jgi:DNA-binding transcriptional LysR family regulator
MVAVSTRVSYVPAGGRAWMEERMELRAPRPFAAVADALSFRVAAEPLHLSQSGATRSMATLEREMGVRLRTRDKRT